MGDGVYWEAIKKRGLYVVLLLLFFFFFLFLEREKGKEKGVLDKSPHCIRGFLFPFPIVHRLEGGKEGGGEREPKQTTFFYERFFLAQNGSHKQSIVATCQLSGSHH